MRFQISVQRMHIIYLVMTLAILTGINYAIAQTASPDPGHPADQIGPGTIAGTLTVTDDGKIGIGTTNPGAKLDVQGDVIVNGGITTDGSDPVNDADVATKGYVDAQEIGDDEYQLVRCGSGDMNKHCTPTCPSGYHLINKIDISSYAYWSAVGLCKKD